MTVCHFHRKNNIKKNLLNDRVNVKLLYVFATRAPQQIQHNNTIKESTVHLVESYEGSNI